ncbi:hypothetical protein CVT24_002890 [Panaeolus cyanescens]|uniref:Uncharacterized protein n=1 Tax=Panaeolus cyanescens TaxID=181874 RepID=A0A409W8Q1_9AGAR|nr:hypothetical protein CVT24_002890 [Panaeolus cyanescens]
MAQEFCSAIDLIGRLDVPCKKEPMEKSKWCPRHNEQRIKLYNSYKAHHASLNAFPEETICRSVGAIKKCSSYDTVKAWSNALRTKYNLLERCIEAREYFTARFFGNDMDFGHRTFWHHLKKQKDEVEKLLERVERKACELFLASQNAMWVLDVNQQTDNSSSNCCGDDDEVATVSAPPPLSADDPEEVEDPVDVALREKRRELQERMRTRLARYLCPCKSSYYMERVRVIWACVSRAICTDPALMLVAQNYVSVVSMLSDDTLDIGMVEKMWSAIKNLGVHDVRAAIDDVLHPVREKGDFVQVLGTRVHKEMTGSVLPFHGWGHMTALFPCALCVANVRRVCTTVDDVVAFVRHSLLTRKELPDGYTMYKGGKQRTGELSLCGFIPNDIVNFAPRSLVEKTNGDRWARDPPVWTETQTNNTICVGLSLTDPKTQSFVNACLRHPDFMVMCRKGPNGQIIQPKPLYMTRVRKATTEAGLKNAPWDPTEDSIYKDSILEDAGHWLTGNTYLQNCFQIVIVDGGEGEVEDFVKKLINVWLQVYGVNDLRGLLKVIGKPYIESGELEVDMESLATNAHANPPIIPNLEIDIQKSYMSLWERTPDDGQLADDELDEFEISL